MIVLWLPIAAVLTLRSRRSSTRARSTLPSSPSAIWGAYLIRSVNYWILGMVTFWTTRVGPIFEMVFNASCCCPAARAALAHPVLMAQLLATCCVQVDVRIPDRALVGRLPEAELLVGWRCRRSGSRFGSMARDRVSGGSPFGATPRGQLMAGRTAIPFGRCGCSGCSSASAP